MSEFDVEQLVEQMRGDGWIGLCAWDGTRPSEFRDWPDARTFWNSREDGG
jgi:hypothetical protein